MASAQTGLPVASATPTGGSPAREAADAASSLPDVATDALRSWLDADTWHESRDLFAETPELITDASAEAVRAMAPARVGAPGVYLALLTLARGGRVDSGYDYLTLIGRAERKRLLLDQARTATDAETFFAYGDLVHGVDLRFSQEASFSERAYGLVMSAVAVGMAGDLPLAVTLATQARRHLSGSARVEWVAVLRELAERREAHQVALRRIQETIVDC
jgi:hypothetical protein